MTNRKLFKPLDFIVLSFVLLVSVLLIFVLFRGDEKIAVITVDGKEYDKIDLVNAEDAVIHLDTTPAVTLEIKDGKIRFTDALCPDKTCEKTGWLEKSGDTAACLPAKVAVTVSGTSQSQDGISY